MAVVTSCERSNRKPTGLFISHNNVTTAVKRLQVLIGLRANYNYRDSSLRGTLLENSGGNQNM